MNSVIQTNGIESLPAELGRKDLFRQSSSPAQSQLRAMRTPSPYAVQWSWACRKLEAVTGMPLEDSPAAPPAPGDVAVVQVEKSGFHKYITTAENRRLRLYPGTQFVGVFGHRYASDA